MSEQEDRAYYRRRQRQEEAAAGAATNQTVRRIHEELADCYEARAGSRIDLAEEPQRQAVAA